MKIPFTIEQFLDVFKNYNQTVWPMQIFLNLSALFILVIIFKKFKWANPVISLLLAFYFFWMGVVYHFSYFASINKVANVFAVLCVLQGLLFVYYGYIKKKLSFSFNKKAASFTGLFFIIYSLLLYPALGFLLGHSYPAAPTFGVPCPTIIFMFGLLLLTDKKVPKILLILPLLWSVVGLSAALNLGIKEDLMLIISGITCLILLYRRDR